MARLLHFWFTILEKVLFPKGLSPSLVEFEFLPFSVTSPLSIFILPDLLLY